MQLKISQENNVSCHISSNIDSIYLEQGLLCQFLVNLRLVGNVTCTIRIIQRAQRFLLHNTQTVSFNKQQYHTVAIN